MTQEGKHARRWWMRECGWDSTSAPQTPRGARVGQEVAQWGLDHYFGPVGH
jgi:hypothetical protein